MSIINGEFSFTPTPPPHTLYAYNWTSTYLITRIKSQKEENYAHPRSTCTAIHTSIHIHIYVSIHTRVLAITKYLDKYSNLLEVVPT